MPLFRVLVQVLQSLGFAGAMLSSVWFLPDLPRNLFTAVAAETTALY